MYRRRLGFAFAALFVAVPLDSQAFTIHVPSEEATIQAGVNAVAAGDTVLVAPGLYTGTGNTNITFFGVDITVRSEAGAAATIIDGERGPRAFTFYSSETPAASVEGFTIRNCGLDLWGAGGAVSMRLGSSPTIKECVFIDNRSMWGGAIECKTSAVIVDCLFENNQAIVGGGIWCIGSLATIRDCVFRDNQAVEGGGVFLRESLGLSRCVFVNNSASVSGGGLGVLGLADPFSYVTNECTFYRNSAPRGSGIHLYVVFQPPTPALLSNTIVAECYTSQLGQSAGGAIECGLNTTAIITCCNLFQNQGGDYVGCLADQLGIDGNVSRDPLFCDGPLGDFTLDAASPCAPENSGPCGLIGALPVACGARKPDMRSEPDVRRDGEFAAAPPPRGRITVRPNPVVDTATFAVESIGEAAMLEIYDLQGRLVDSLVSGELVTWNPGQAVPSGIYFARLRGGGGSQVARFTVIR